MEKSAYLDIYTSTSILFPIAKYGSWNKAVEAGGESLSMYIQ